MRQHAQPRLRVVSEDSDAGFQAPWSASGHYGEDVRRRRNPELTRLMDDVAGRGIFGFARLDDRPGGTLGMHNPYFNVAFGIGAVALGVFLVDKLGGTPWLAILVSGFFFLGAVAIIVVQVGRIPGWHRARKVAKRYISVHGGKLPPEAQILS